MTTREIKNTIAAVQLHDLADTNALAVRTEGGMLIIETDTSELEEQIAALRTKAADLEREVSELEQDTERLAELQELLDQFKDGTATVLEYKERAEAAEAAERSTRARYVEAQTECLALRKRKGFGAALFKHARKVLAYLHDNPAPEAQALVAKIHADK